MNNIIKYIPLSNEEEIINAFNKTYYDDKNYYLDFDTILMHLNQVTNVAKNENEIRHIIQYMITNGILKTNKANNYKLTNQGYRIKSLIECDMFDKISNIGYDTSDEQNSGVYIVKNQMTNDLHIYVQKAVTKSIYGKRCLRCRHVIAIEDIIYKKLYEDDYSYCEQCARGHCGNSPYEVYSSFW
jgi:hypothetical protein